MNTLSVSTLRAGTKPTNLTESVETSLKVLADDEPIPQGHRIWRILSKEKGDERIVWDSDSLNEINEARRLFDQLRDKGLVAHRVGVDGRAEAEIIDEFDPLAEEILFLPRQLVAGG